MNWISDRIIPGSRSPSWLYIRISAVVWTFNALSKATSYLSHMMPGCDKQTVSGLYRLFLVANDSATKASTGMLSQGDLHDFFKQTGNARLREEYKSAHTLCTIMYHPSRIFGNHTHLCSLFIWRRVTHFHNLWRRWFVRILNKTVTGTGESHERF